jgi:hypothetical protein
LRVLVINNLTALTGMLRSLIKFAVIYRIQEHDKYV